MKEPRPKHQYPAIPDADGTPENTLLVLNAMRRTIEQLIGAVGPKLDTAVTFRDLLDYRVLNKQQLAAPGAPNTAILSLEEQVALAQATADQAILDAAAAQAAADAAGVHSYFFVHKNGTNQTGISSGVDTDVTWSTERYDVGGYFASNIWTPPAGKLVFLYTQCFLQGAFDQINIRIHGINDYMGRITGDTHDPLTVSTHALEVANGSTGYKVQAVCTTTAGTFDVLGNSDRTFFLGMILN